MGVFTQCLHKPKKSLFFYEKGEHCCFYDFFAFEFTLGFFGLGGGVNNNNIGILHKW